MRRWLDGIVGQWLVPTLDTNPGMIEMMRLRDRNPPYQDPVPWAGEFVGKYMTSLALVGRLTDSPALRETAQRVKREMVGVQASDGYLGPFQEPHLGGNWDLWGHYHCMLGLWRWYQDTGDQEARAAAIRIGDLVVKTFLGTGRRVHDAGSHEMNMSILHSLALVYRETKNEAYLRMIREIEKDWQKPPAGDYYRQALAGTEFYRMPKPRWESLHPIIGMAELYRITGDDSYRTALLNVWRSIQRTDVHNVGSFSTREQAVGNPFEAGAIETCCTVAWMELSVEALRLSADSRIADALELSTWNAALAYEHPSGQWCTYDTPMDGKRVAALQSIVFQARPGTPELNCCSANAANGLGQLGQWAVLGDSRTGVHLNFYGPCTLETGLENGAKWRFVQATDYPKTGRIEIRVDEVSAASASPLFLRIPEWSKRTSVAVNGQSVDGVVPGRYLRLARAWKSGDVISLELDMGVRALRGDAHVRFNSSLLRGPIALAFDQKHNAVDPDAMPELDLNALGLEALSGDAPELKGLRFAPIEAFAVKSVDGARLVLCDYASAGAYGTQYRSWLPVRHAPPAPYALKYPEDGEKRPAEAIRFAWDAAEPGSRYTLRIAKDKAFKETLLEQVGLEQNAFDWSPPVGTAGTCYWSVAAVASGREGQAVNGPFAFTLDPALPSSMHGVVVRSALAGGPEPQEGRLVRVSGVAPAKGRGGQEKGALAFDGKTSRLVYEAAAFPLRTYTFAAWVCPRGFPISDGSWHQIVSAWCANANDPIRLGVTGDELKVSLEQPNGGSCAFSCGRVENGKWIHVALVKEFAELRMYLDGRLIGKRPLAATLELGAKEIGIGCNPNYSGAEAFSGEISDVLFTREAVSEQELAKQAAAR